MRRPLYLLAGIAVPLLVGFAALHTGLARRAFFGLFAYVKGVDVLGPTVLREPPVASPYQRWLEAVRDEIPVDEGLVIQDVHTVALRPWPQLGDGVRGLYLHFADYQTTDGRIVEIPAGGATHDQRHLYEKAVYVLDGSGYTVIQQEGRPQARFDWQRGDLFSIPLNARHRFRVAEGAPTRLLAVTDFPLMLNVMDDADFLHEDAYAFDGRYDGSPGYFEPAHNEEDVEVETHFVDDVPTAPTQPFDYRGRGNRVRRWQMAGNSALCMHVAEMPPRMYKKAHRHTDDAFILLLSGEGFSVTWPEGAYHERVRVDWQPGTLFAPPTYWYHQHLNTGSEAARYLAIHPPNLVRNIGLRFSDQLEADLEPIREEWREATAE